PLETLGDRNGVGRPVVHDGDGGHRSRLVDATPVRRGSRVTAARRARASALKAASATWWSLRPVADRCSVRPALRTNASRAWGMFWVARLPSIGWANVRSITGYGRPLTSTAAWASASSIGTT